MNKFYLIFIFVFNILQANAQQFLDISPIYVHLDLLDSHKTIEKLDLVGIRAEGRFNIYKGILLKPMGLYAKSPQHGRGEIYTLQTALGHYLPIAQNFVISPLLGVSYNYASNPIPGTDYNGERIRPQENFHAWQPFVGLEAILALTSNLRIYGEFHYGWSSSTVTIKNAYVYHEHAQGPNLACWLEYDLLQCWSANAGVFHNISLTEEKHGIRTSGIKAGIKKWF